MLTLTNSSGKSEPVFRWMNRIGDNWVRTSGDSPFGTSTYSTTYQVVKGTYKLDVLSDAWINTREKVQEWINYDLFDAIIFSFEVRVSKPDPSPYTNILSRLNVAAEECIFVDDRTVNVECVRGIGRKAMQYNGDMDIRAAVEQLTTKG